MAKAISYRRVSLGRQALGDGLRRQDDAALQYCEEKGDQLDETFIDAGMSAYRGKNAAVGRLGRIMDLAEAGTWEPGTKLLVEHFDRLSRDKLVDARQRAERILKAGLMIVTLADRQEYTWDRINDDLGAIILMTVMMFKSHEESKLKGGRVAASKAIRREASRRGEVKMTRQTPHWLEAKGEGKNFRVVIRDKPVTAIRRMCEDAVSGMGKRLITTRLNNNKIPPPKGARGWHHSTVGALLRDRRLIGEFQPMMVTEDGKRVPNGDPIPNYFPAIIDKTMFRRVQAAISGRRYREGEKGSGGRKGRGFPNLFLGLGKCICGAPLVYEHTGGRRKNRRALVCSDAIRGHKGCLNRKQFYYPELEADLIRTLSLLDFSRFISTPRTNSDRGPELTTEINERLDQQRRLLEAFTSRTPQIVLDRIATLETEIADLRAELRGNFEKAAIAESLRDRDNHAEFLSLIGRMNTEMTEDERFMLRAKLAQEFRRIIAEMIADETGITVRLKPASHQRIEFRLEGNAVATMTLWSREIIHPDYPANDMRPVWKLTREQLFHNSDLIGLLSQFTAA
jgi:hypothetical protein